MLDVLIKCYERLECSTINLTFLQNDTLFFLCILIITPEFFDCCGVLPSDLCGLYAQQGVKILDLNICGICESFHSIIRYVVGDGGRFVLTGSLLLMPFFFLKKEYRCSISLCFHNTFEEGISISFIFIITFFFNYLDLFSPKSLTSGIF